MQQTNSPPARIDPSDLWGQLTTLPRPTKEIGYPRRHPVTGDWLEARVSVQVLTEAELMSARAAADTYAKSVLKDAQKSGDANLGYQDIYRNALVVEVIVRACRAPGMPGNPPAFPNAELARKFVTSDEFAVLFQAYCDFQAESGPIISMMTNDEMEQWLERLAEGASQVPLAALSSDAKNLLLLHSASRLRALRTGSGSAGPPPSGSSTEISPESPNDSSPPEASRPTRPEPS